MGFFVGVFDLELSQRRATVKTPVHRFEAAVDKAPLHHPLESANFSRFIDEVHGAVGRIPCAEHTQALEVFTLLVDLLAGKGTAFGLHLVALQLAPMQFFDGVFDGQAVAVPARDVVRIQPFELARLDDHVFENLVGGMPDVNLAIGIGRTVMQHKLGRVMACLAQLLVGARFIPGLDPARFALGQVGAHRKRRVWQVQRAAVIGRCGLVGHGAGNGLAAGLRLASVRFGRAGFAEGSGLADWPDSCGPGRSLGLCLFSGPAGSRI